jgi:redox-regulated HSP33 family molecular chaperone
MNQNIDDIRKNLQTRDRTVRVISKDGNFRVACVKNSNAARTAQVKHDLYYFPAVFLAKTLSGASLLASFLKGEERVILEIDAQGPITKIFAEAMQLGEIRGYINMNKSAQLSKFDDMNFAIIDGLLKVTKIMYNRKDPVVGIIPVTIGNIDSDLANYFLQSEQIPAAVILDVDFDDKGLIEHSGGLIVQAMPGHTESQLLELHSSLSKINGLTQFYKNDENPLNVLKHILPFEFDLISSTQVDFFCRCSKSGFMQKLMTLGLNEIIDMKSHNDNELVCQYCNNHFYLEEVDFDKMIEEQKARLN